MAFNDGRSAPPIRPLTRRNYLLSPLGRGIHRPIIAEAVGNAPADQGRRQLVRDKARPTIPRIQRSQQRSSTRVCNSSVSLGPIDLRASQLASGQWHKAKEGTQSITEINILRFNSCLIYGAIPKPYRSTYKMIPINIQEAITQNLTRVGLSIVNQPCLACFRTTISDTISLISVTNSPISSTACLSSMFSGNNTIELSSLTLISTE